MRNRLFAVLFVFVCFALSCEKARNNPYEDLDRDELTTLLGELREEIQTLASAVPCTDSEEWKLADIETVCGPGNIAYHQSVDTAKLRRLIRNHNQAMKIYRPLVAPLIYCTAYSEALGIACEDGKAVIVYEPFEDSQH